MKIFLKTSGPVVLFFLVITLGFALWLVPRLGADLTQWDDDSERNNATILAEALSNDMKAGRHAAVGATLSRVWANRPDWALVEAFDDQGQRIYPTSATLAPTPCTLCNRRNQFCSASLRKPNRRMASSRTWVSIQTVTASPTGGRACRVLDEQNTT